MARAFGGALLFSLPMLMTMEMWSLGVTMDRWRLALLLLLMVPLLIGLAYYIGFESVTGLGDAALDAFAAIAVAVLLTSAIMVLFGVLRPEHSLREWIGRIAIQSLTASIGALLAHSQLGQSDRENRERRESDFAEYFFMAAGALFLSTNVAPTEEVELIAHMMSPWHSLALIFVSLLAMHAFVYAVDFRGQHSRAEHVPPLSEFVRFTLIGYILAVSISAFLCWCFGRFDDVAVSEMLRIAIVLGFPAALGAAAARLVL